MCFLKDLGFDEDCVITSLTCGIFEDTHLKSLFISSNVEDIEPRSICGIKNISISLRSDVGLQINGISWRMCSFVWNMNLL